MAKAVTWNRKDKAVSIPYADMEKLEDGGSMLVTEIRPGYELSVHKEAKSLFVILRRGTIIRGGM